MNRNRNRNLFAGLVALTACGVGAFVLAGCTGEVGSSGGTSPPVCGPAQTTPMQPVSPSDISGPVEACGTGYAHPNVCCVAAAGTPSSCASFTDAPFQQCDNGTTTYPDPRTCCPLGGNGDCVAPSPAPPPDPTCTYACPPGQYQPDGASIGTCCATDPTGATTCSDSTGTSCAVPVGCACPACEEGQDCPPCDCGPTPSCPPAPSPPECGETDCACAACEEGQACPPCECPPPTPCPVDPPPSCGDCPPGWQAPDGVPYLCCSQVPSGALLCFSQGVPPSPAMPQPTPVQAGTGTSN